MCEGQINTMVVQFIVRASKSLNSKFKFGTAISTERSMVNEHDEHMKFIKLFLAYRSVQKSRL